MATKRTVVWFRNDLRIFDNPTLHAAAARALKERTELACVYCFDPRHFTSTKYSAHKTGIYRSKFLIESVSNLRENLRSIGGELFVALAKPEELLLQIASAGEIFAQAEVTSEETSVERKVAKSCGNLNLILGGNTLHHPEDLPYARGFSDLPAVFTNYRQHVEKVGVKVRPLLPALKKGSLPRSPAVPILPSGTGTAAGSALPTSATQCGYDYLPTLHELGFSQQEIDTYAQATTSADVLRSLRALETLPPAAPSAGGAPTSPPTSAPAPAPPAPPMSATSSMPRLAHPAGVMSFTGGETAALQRLQAWMFDGDHLKDYFDIRNGMLGEGYSTKLSPWLALGCISPRYDPRAVPDTCSCFSLSCGLIHFMGLDGPCFFPHYAWRLLSGVALFHPLVFPLHRRHVYHESKRYERERGIANKSTYWLTFELLVRDFFRFYCVQHGAAVFYPYGPMSVIKAAKQAAGAKKGGGKSTGKPAPTATAPGKPTPQSLASLRAEYKWSSEDTSAIAAWKGGQTGQPLVDANMRELLLTGKNVGCFS
jgi:deoxyribodipyrimidine photolyase